MILPTQWLERAHPADFIVHHECWPAFELYQQCATQWRITGTGHRSGLDYAAVAALAQIRGCATAQEMEFVRYLELGALACFYGKDLEYVLDG